MHQTERNESEQQTSLSYFMSFKTVVNYVATVMHIHTINGLWSLDGK